MTTNRQNRIAQIQIHLEELEKRKALWEKEASVNPSNLQAQEMAPHLTKQIEQVQIHLAHEIEEAELASNPDSPKAKTELKELDQINKAGSKLMDDITKAAIALDGQIQELLTLQKQADKLGKRYDKKPFYSGLAINRIQTMGHAITRWRQEVRSWESHKESTANPDPNEGITLPNAKKGIFGLSDNDKMLKERYPERKG